MFAQAFHPSNEFIQIALTLSQIAFFATSHAVVFYVPLCVVPAINARVAKLAHRARLGVEIAEGHTAVTARHGSDTQKLLKRQFKGLPFSQRSPLVATIDLSLGWLTIKELSLRAKWCKWEFLGTRPTSLALTVPQVTQQHFFFASTVTVTQEGSAAITGRIDLWAGFVKKHPFAKAITWVDIDAIVGWLSFRVTHLAATLALPPRSSITRSVGPESPRPTFGCGTHTSVLLARTVLISLSCWSLIIMSKMILIGIFSLRISNMPILIEVPNSTSL
jgi:hypothetical protein